MISLHLQILNLKLPYLLSYEWSWYVDNEDGNYYQNISYIFNLTSYPFNFKIVLSSKPDQIEIFNYGPDPLDRCIEHFLENITEDLAEIFYFNMDLWRKINC